MIWNRFHNGLVDRQNNEEQERSLKPEEVMEVTNMARPIAAILLLEPELDANYQAVKQSTYQWSQENRHE